MKFAIAFIAGFIAPTFIAVAAFGAEADTRGAKMIFDTVTPQDGYQQHASSIAGPGDAAGKNIARK